MVVPMLAPMMTATLCESVISPAEMNPTINTVVTEEDWMTAVAKAPTPIPTKRLRVSFPSRSFM